LLPGIVRQAINLGQQDCPGRSVLADFGPAARQQAILKKAQGGLPSEKIPMPIAAQRGSTLRR